MGLESFLITIHVMAAVAIVGLVLLQRGKGAEMGASFGSGASQTMFGSVGSGNFLTKSTTLMTVVFFTTSLGLAIIANQRADSAVQDDSLIRGDIQQITAPPSDSPAPGLDASAQGGASVSGADGDVPVIETAAIPQEAAEGAENVGTEGVESAPPRENPAGSDGEE